MYDDPMEYQRTKRSYIHEDDTGLSNEDDDDNDNDDDIGDEGFYDEDEDEDDRSYSPAKSLKDPGSSVLHKKDEIHQVHVNASGQQQQPLNMEEDGKSPDEAGSSDDDEGSSSGSGSAEVRGERSYAR